MIALEHIFTHFFKNLFDLHFHLKMISFWLAFKGAQYDFSIWSAKRKSNFLAPNVHYHMRRDIRLS